MGDDSEWMKLPTDEKVQHKIWKARLAGYEEAIKLFKTQGDEKSPEFLKFAPLIKKFVTDSNAVAQEKGLEAVIAFVENAAVAPKIAHEVISGVVTKCLSASKQKTKDNGKEIIMLYVEAEKQDVVIEDVLEGWTNKNPKVVTASVQVLREALWNFGNKVIQIKPMVKFLPKLLEDRDKNVREETKQLVIEIYRWVGAAIKPKLVDFKPVQVAELEAEFEKLPSSKPQQQRYLRSQQDLKAKMEEKAAMAEAGEEEEEGAEGDDDVDPYELMEAVNVLAALPKDFFDKVEAKKWQERKEVLEPVQKLCESPKIEAGDYGSLVKALSKVVAKDTNVMMVALGAKCLAGLATGLRKKFSPYASSCVQVYLDKFKEKKLMVVTALREAIDAAYLSISLEPLIEDVTAALENKNPNIKAECASFLARCFSRLTLTTLPKKQLKTFCSSLLKTVNDTAPEVREASFMALGTAMKVVTEKHIMAYMADVDALKMQKGAARPKTAPAKMGGPPKGAAKPGGPPRKKEPAKKGKAPVEEKTEKILSDEAVIEKATELLGAETLGQLENTNWKERLAGMENFTKIISRMTKDMIPCQVCIRTVAKKPGFKDNNFQVLKLRVELVSKLALNAEFTKVSAEYCLPDLVDKVADVKNGAAVQEAFSCIAEATSLDFVAGEVMRMAFAQKNPKNQSEALNWLSKAVTEFGLKVQVKPHIENIKKAFAHTNPAVRTSAIGLCATLYQYMGQQLRMFFEDEKAALLQQIDAEFEKVKGVKPPAPTRGLKAADDDDDDDDNDDNKDADEGDDAADLVPRNDIGDKFSPELIESLSDKNWKVRGEGLQNVIKILNDAKFITGNLGPLPEAVKARLGDNNKNLVTTTVGICATLATNMGRHCKQHIKVIGPALIGCLGDSKPALRAAAIGALNAWVDQTTLTPLVECEAFSDALKLENPNLRQELLGWLTERLPNHKQLPKDELKLCVPHLLTCLEDRNGEVRKKAGDALVPFMMHIGYDSVFKATTKLKPASKDQIMQIIEKARENLPAKQPKKKPTSAPPSSKAPPAVSNDYEEPEPPTARKEKSPSAEPPETKVAKGPGKTKAKSVAAPSKKKKVEEDTGPPLTITETKEKRFKEEKNMKTLKWNFMEPKAEYVEQLRNQMEKNFSKAMMDMMFHSDFKFHTKAIETLISCMDSAQTEQLANLDLILKWFTLRFFDTNPSMLNKSLEYLQNLFKLLIDIDYNLHEIEAVSFVPYLVIKVGENKDNVRRDVRSIFKLLYKVYPASKMFVFILDGVKSKNSKQRTECLEELGYLIETYGISICQPSSQVALKIIAGQISERDNGVRNAALNTVVCAYMILGEGIYKQIGKLKDKELNYLEERIKRSSKTKPPAPAQKEPKERPKSAPQQPQRSNTQPQIQRSMTGIPKSQSSNTMRKEFQIDIEDDSNKENYQMPQLIQFSGLDDLLQPCEMPKKKTRPPSPAHKFLNSADTSETVSFVISQVTNRDVSTCMKALLQLDEVITDPDKSSVMEDHVEQLLVAMSMQFKMIYSTFMGDDDLPKDDVTRLYRCLLGTLLSLFQNAVLASHASKDISKELIYNLVTMLLDNRLMELEEGPQVVRAVNVLVVKIVEKSDQTNILCALVRLLQECVASQTCSNKMLEIIMKCLWKIVKMLPDTYKQLNLDRVLYEIHIFLRTFPSSTWKERGNDLPLRTVKTLVHSMTKLKGSKILNHLGQIDAGEASELKSYIQKVLKSEGSTQQVDTEVNGTSDDNKTPRSSSKSRHLSKTTHDMLTEIFKKVGSKENTREGLQDLHEFKKKYPDADIVPYLKKTSHFFQNYIERGLKAIEREERESQEGKIGNDVRGSHISEDGNIGQDGYTDKISKLSQDKLTGNTTPMSGVQNDLADAGYYMERLRKLRAQAGLQSEDKKSAETSEINVPSYSTEHTPSPPRDDGFTDDSSCNSDTNRNSTVQQPSPPKADVSDLKARLERIKQMAKS
ncbi:Cytoskeleton associated protein 5 [Mactra antiquata]